MIEIVKATEDHIQIIQNLAHLTWPHTFNKILSPEQINYMLKWMYSREGIQNHIRHDGAVFLLAMDSDTDQFTGFASYNINHNNEAKTKLHKIYILPSQQGNGVGLALIKRVEEIALENKNFTISLNVNRNNKAIHFYTKIGFRIVKEENIDIGEGFWMEDYVMEKNLSINN